MAVAVTIYSVVELSVLIGVGGWVKPRFLRVMFSSEAVFPLCKINTVSLDQNLATAVGLVAA